MNRLNRLDGRVPSQPRAIVGSAWPSGLLLPCALLIVSLAILALPSPVRAQYEFETYESSTYDPFAPRQRPAGHLALLLGRLALADDDLDRTYGSVLTYGVRLALTTPNYLRLTLEALYGRKTGNPFYDTPDFVADRPVQLQMVPIRFGIDINFTRHDHYRFYAGPAIQLAWMREEVPSNGDLGSGETDTYTGWGFGWLLRVAPELRLGGTRHAVGLELAWGGSSGKLARQYSRHYMDISGFNLEAYYTLRL